MNSKDKTVLIGMPCGSGQVPTAMVQSLLQLRKPCPAAFMVVDRQRTDKARNAIAMEALKQNMDYLLFLDDDNPVPPETLEVLMEDDKDVVIAPILARNPDQNGNYKMCAFYEMKSDAPVKLYKEILGFRDEGPLHRIDSGGCGCMLIKRHVLQALFDKYKDTIFEYGDTRFDEIEVEGEKYTRRTMSEDCEFSERVVEAGYEIFLDDRIRPVHLGAPRAVQWKPLT